MKFLGTILGLLILWSVGAGIYGCFTQHTSAEYSTKEYADKYCTDGYTHQHFVFVDGTEHDVYYCK